MHPVIKWNRRVSSENYIDIVLLIEWNEVHSKYRFFRLEKFKSTKIKKFMYLNRIFYISLMEAAKI